MFTRVTLKANLLEKIISKVQKINKMNKLDLKGCKNNRYLIIDIYKGNMRS